jgi:hypothetical protein
MRENVEVYLGIDAYLRQTGHPHAESASSDIIPHTVKLMRWVNRRSERVLVVISTFMDITGEKNVVIIGIESAQMPSLSATATSRRGYTAALEKACAKMREHIMMLV